MASYFAESLGGSYTGDVVDGLFHGHGVLVLPSGVKYNGQFKEGQFHGRGELHFPNGSVYTAMWEEGVEVADSGAYTFVDKLAYTTPWKYLDAQDRRFWSEVQAGKILPGDDVARKNEPMLGGSSAAAATAPTSAAPAGTSSSAPL